jgi:NAD(P)-dependent dehydrogenase (short-subunit alcohol dehydrogenase family)
MDINVKGVFNFCKYATPYFKKKKSGVIINTSSVTGIYGSGMGCPYPTSKAAIIGLTKSLAIELAPWKIRVNAVAPGVVNTEMVAVLNEQERKTFTNSIPLKRMGEAEDISYAMLYLASDWASYVTGITIQVDGGYRPSNVNM